MDAVMRQDGVRPIAEVLLRAGQLAEAIDFAASAGVHHGMMAPCDVILEGERTGVTGIGLAQALIKAGIPAEAVSPYGSPQRLAGALPTRADDIYSLAAITLELLIGTPRDPDQDTSRALREAQGLPERRRVPRPAAHETRLFTMIAGVDAGKLRASFAAAFAEEPSERPSTASEFVARFQDAVSSRRVTDEPAPSVVAAAVVSDEPECFSEEREDPPSAPVLDVKRTEVGATLEQPSRQERVVAKGRGARRRARRRAKSAMSQPLIQESHEHERREGKSESRVARPVPSEVEGPEPIDDVALFADVTPPRARSIDEASSCDSRSVGNAGPSRRWGRRRECREFCDGIWWRVHRWTTFGARDRVAARDRVERRQPPRAGRCASTRAPCSRGSKANRFANAAGCSNFERAHIEFRADLPLAASSSARRRPVPSCWLTAKSTVSRRSPCATLLSERIRLRSRTRVTARGSRGSR